jgi:hypothetical protein
MLFVAMFAAAAVAAVPAPTDSKAQSGANQVVCRNMTYTGSRLGATKVCRTKQEWNEIQAEHDRLLRQQQSADRSLKSGA